MMSIHRFRAALTACILACGIVATPAWAGAPPAPAGWPRHVPLAQGALLVYSPQVVRWDGDRIVLRSAVALRGGSSRDETFGTIEATASTHVDKVLRSVALADLAIAKIDLPALPDRGASLLPQLNAAARSTLRIVSLDRLQASLAASRRPPRTVAVDDTPPRVIVSTSPAILVPIDGTPVWKPVAGSVGFTRMVNTRALILKSAATPQMFMHVYDGWLMAESLAGQWTQPFLPPTGIDAVARKVAATGVVDMLDGGKRAKPKPSLAQGVPAIHTSEVPTEIIVFRGNPDFAPLVGTSLAWATNTTSDVLRDTASGTTYVLLAGRWFRAPSLAGPWTFVASDALPADFARIPPTSLAGAVLPAVAGTPQARAAMAENAVPQTATVPRVDGPSSKAPTFEATYDGPPQFVAEPGTSLTRAVNASVPIVKVASGAYYALTAGIWFTAMQPDGPWSIATSIPDAIYTIPPTSPIYFATFARIYGVTPNVVFTGYTPGYLGAMASTGGTVVYGTGYPYRSWIGERWYPAPATYGLAAAPVFNPHVGYTYGFAVGLATAAWSQAHFGGARFHPGYWGSYPCCGSASANVYRAWFKPGKGKKMRRGATASSTAAASSATAAPSTTPTTTANAPIAAAGPVMTTQQAMNGGVPPTVQGYPAPPALPAAAASAGANSGPQVPIRHMGPVRGYDMDLVSNADAPPQGPAAKGSAPAYISANAYYASLVKDGGWSAQSSTNETYAGDDGKVYRHQGDAWQRHDGATWAAEPAPPVNVVAEAQTRANVDPGMVAGAYGMSNATRFTGSTGDGWSRRDAGDGGYSRTLGGDGGISAERSSYDNQVMDNAFDIDMNGGWWSDSVSLGGVGWSGRLGAD